jgi:hypothetical protein
VARIQYVARLAVDKTTGMPRPALAGQTVTIVRRGTSTPATIWEDEAGTLLIPGSLRTVSTYLFIGAFWVDETDMPVSALGDGVEVALESVEGLAKQVAKVVPTVASSPVKPTGEWWGTQAQYNAIGSPDPTVIYNILS